VKVIDKIPVWFRRVFVIGVLVLLGVFVSLGFIAKSNIIDQPPSAAKAPWAIQTTTRIYYAKQFRLNGETPEIRGYWTFDGKHYQYNEGIKDFPNSIYKGITPVRRAK
jgi:hypothetical protein